VVQFVVNHQQLFFCLTWLEVFIVALQHKMRFSNGIKWGEDWLDMPTKDQAVNPIFPAVALTGDNWTATLLKISPVPEGDGLLDSSGKFPDEWRLWSEAAPTTNGDQADWDGGPFE
jgi:hypothetical protein